MRPHRRAALPITVFSMARRGLASGAEGQERMACFSRGNKRHLPSPKTL